MKKISLSISTLIVSAILVVGCQAQAPQQSAATQQSQVPPTQTDTQASSSQFSSDSNQISQQTSSSVSSSESASAGTSTWVTYTNKEHGFSLQYPSTFKKEEITASEINIPHYLMLNFPQDNGDRLQIFLNPGGHGDPCMIPDDTATPIEVSMNIGGIEAKGESCANGATEYYDFQHGSDSFSLILTTFMDPKDLAQFHQVLSTIKFN